MQVNICYLLEPKFPFLLCRIPDLGDQQESIQPASSLPSSSYSHVWTGEGQEDEGTLSDLDPDIEQYLASEKEVRNSLFEYPTPCHVLLCL